MSFISAFCVLMQLLFILEVYSEEKPGIKNKKATDIKIRLKFNDTVLTAAMYDFLPALYPA